MAFTEAQKVKIRFYLGFPDTFQQNNTRLESAFDVIGGRPDVQAFVETILASLATVETSVASSLSSAGLKRAEDIEWYQSGSGSAAISQKLSEGRRYCARLSIVFGVPLVGDAFGTRGFEGDSWMGRSFQYGVVPLG